MKRTGNQR